jgi:hypothetical protein
VCSLILFPYFATGVVDTFGKFATGVVDTGGKFATRVLETSGKLPPVSLKLAKLVANLLPVSLIPLVHLDLRISPQIFEES